MAIPKYDELYAPFLECIKNGEEYSFSQIVEYCSSASNLTEEEKNAVTSSGSPLFRGRVGWARTYLKKAGLISSPTRGVFQITEEGLKAVNLKQKIDNEYLLQFEPFVEFYQRSVEDGETESQDKTQPLIISTSPEEQIDQSIEALNDALADELMEQVLSMSCYSFEHFVIQLLISMGYGSLLDNENSATKKSGDGGIDGILKADKFGFDSIYIQAKQWKESSSVGSPEIQKFAGAMSLHGATKGLFITTAKFTKEAYNTAKINPACKLVLIDGKQLARLMIEYDVGVSTKSVYKIKEIDTDFFNQF